MSVAGMKEAHMGAVAESVREMDPRGGRWGSSQRFGVVDGGANASSYRRDDQVGSIQRQQSVPTAARPVHAQEREQYGGGRDQSTNGGDPRDQRQEARDERRPAQTHTNQTRQGYGDQRQGGYERDNRPSRGTESSASRGEGGGRGQATEQGREFHSVHVYGGKAALCFSADVTRGGEHTVRVEGAPSKGQRQYDWSQKVSLQFTGKELPKVLCVLMGWLDSVEFSAHGQANDKAISMANQAGGKVFINLRQGKTARAVPVTAEDVFGIADLVIKQTLKGSPHLTSDSVLTMVRAMVRRYEAS